jgi:hypothetical protein
MKNEGYIYLICDNLNNKYKIGMTKGDINKRMKQLQTGNSNELFIHSYYKTKYPFRLEKILHNKFTNYNTLNEWFELPDSDVINFSNSCKEQEDIILSLLDNPFFSKNLK